MSAIGCRSEKEKKDAAMSSVLDPPKLSMKALCRPQTTSPLLDGGERSPALDISHMSLSSASPGVLSAISIEDALSAPCGLCCRDRIADGPQPSQVFKSSSYMSKNTCSGLVEDRLNDQEL